MINKLVLENLRYRWVRTFLSALVVGVQVMSILTLIGLSRGLLQDSATRAKGTGADIFLKPGSHATFSLSSAPISEKFIKVVQKQPHVVQAVGVLAQPIEAITTLNGVDIPAFANISGGFRYLAGGPPRAPDDLLVDQYYAKQHHLKAGQSVPLLGHNFHLTGIIQNGVLAHLIVQLPALQKLTSNTGNVSEILVKLDDPSRTKEQVDNLNKLLNPDLQAISIEDFVSQFSISNLPSLSAFIAVITALSVVVGFLVVFLSMYTAVVERTREIGILKALGAKPLTIVDLLVREALVLGIVGFVIGILLAYAAKLLIMNTVPASFQVIDVPDWWPKAAAIALGGALLGAIYPGLKAAQQDAIEALAYE